VNGLPGWVLDYGKRDGARRRRYFRTQQDAAKALRGAQKDSVAVGRRWAYLPPEDRAEAVAVLGEIRAAGLTLRNVWEGFRNGTAANLSESKGLGDAVRELVRTKTAANCRPAYVTSLEQYLSRWARGQEAKPIAKVNLSEIDAFLGGLPSLSSRATAINRLSTLFSFAVRKGWRLDNPCERVERPRIDNGTPAILTVEEVKRALRFVRSNMPRFIPWLALALFAGVRPEEADKLTWESIDLKRRLVTLDAATTKVRRRRIVHLKPVAVAWLRLKGDLPLPRITRRRYLRRLRDALGWSEWKKDVLRHTAASYWLASEPDAAAVARELGNSEKVLLTHYVDLVDDREAKKFWALRPKSGKARA
jgi:integrase